MDKEKREYSRVEVSWPVSIIASKGLVEGEVKNICFEGALIRCSELADVDEALELNIVIPEQDYLSISVGVEIVWSKTHESEDRSQTTYDLGVRFVEISEEDLQLLSNTVLY